MAKDVNKKVEDGYSNNARKTISLVKSAIKSIPSLEKHNISEMQECEALCKELLQKVEEYKAKNKEKYIAELKSQLAYAESI